MNFDIISSILGFIVGAIFSIYGTSLKFKFQTKKELNDEIDRHFNEIKDLKIFAGYFQNVREDSNPTNWSFNLKDSYLSVEQNTVRYDNFNCVASKEFILALSNLPKGLNNILRELLNKYDIIADETTLKTHLFYNIHKVESIQSNTVYLSNSIMRFDRDSQLAFYPLSDAILSFGGFNILYHDYIKTLIKFRNLPWYKIIFTRL